MATISRNGFVIEKDLLTPEIQKKIQVDLFVLPFSKEDYKIPQPFKVYTQDEHYYYLPREWALKNIKLEQKIKYDYYISEYDYINIKFNGILKYHQILAVENILKIFLNKKRTRLRKKAGGVICIPPGYGKTVIAIFIAVFLKLKTLIVVHKTFLLEQWIERITQYTNAKIGTIQQEKMDIYNKDIVVGMLQSLNSRDYGDNLESFQFIIFDECHHLGAQVFSKILQKTQSPYLLGLSATPERNDKLEHVFYSYLGNIIFRMDDKVDQNVKIDIYKFKTDNEKFRILYNRYTKKYNYAKMVSNLTEIDERNTLITNIIKNVFDKEPTRQLFLLTNRRNHLDVLKQKLDLIFPDQVAFYCGGMKKKELKKSESKQIILGTFEMASEGLDIADLDTLVLATPKSSITQSLGRIMRKNKNDYINNPLIIDIYDDSGIYIQMAKKRIMLYKNNYIKNNTDITFYNCNNENNYEIKSIKSEIPLEYKKLELNNIGNLFDSESESESDLDS